MISEQLERFHHGNDRRTQCHQEKRWKDEEHQREDQLDGGLGRRLLHCLHALGSEAYRNECAMSWRCWFQTVPPAPAWKPDCARSPRRCVPPDASRHRREGGRRAAPAPRCPIHRTAPAGLRQFLGGARRRLVQAQSGLDANHQKIKHIGQAAPNLALADWKSVFPARNPAPGIPCQGP